MMVRHEADQGACGKPHHLAGRAAPDCAAHRQQVVAPKPVSQAEPLDQTVECKLGVPPHGVLRLAVETEDVADQHSELRTQKISPLAEYCVRVLGAPLEPAAADRGG